MSKKIVLIFENLREIHLKKDVGIIPRLLNEKFNYNIEIKCISSEFDYQKYKKNIKISFYNKSSFKFINKIVLFFSLLKNVKKTDIVITFWGERRKIVLLNFLKILNPNIVTYVKLDMGELTALGIKEKEKRKNFFLKKIEKIFFKNIDIFTVETRKSFSILKSIDKYKNLYYLPNGVLDKNENVSFQKENIILVVGRIGVPQKNHYLILNSLKFIKDFNGYKIYFIGPIDKNFKKYAEEFFNKYPKLKNVVFFKGEVRDNNKLNDLYKKGKILMMSSLYEGFSLVYLEGGSFGNYIFSSDIAAACDITNNGDFGTIVNINYKVINKYLNDFLKQNKIKSFEKYIENKINEIIYSDWFEWASKEYALKLEEVIYDGKIVEKGLKQKEYILKGYNWDLIVDELNNLFLKKLKG